MPLVGSGANGSLTRTALSNAAGYLQWVLDVQMATNGDKLLKVKLKKL